MKHVLQDSINTSDQGTSTQTIHVAVGTINPNPFAIPANQVKAGSKIFLIHFHIEFMCVNAGQTLDLVSKLIWGIRFNINGAQTFANINGLATDHLRNQYFRIDNALMFQPGTNAAGQAVTSPERVIYDFDLHVPKQYQLINDGDEIQLVWRYDFLNGTADSGVNKVYGSTIVYKEFFP